MVIRTPAGAFCLIECSTVIAMELYSGLPECQYHVECAWYRVCMITAAILIMPSVILLGNCTFNMQAAIGAAYMALNVAYWSIRLLSLKLSWNLSRYKVVDITPRDAKHAHLDTNHFPYSRTATLPSRGL